jgi:glycosyltransferase involved in cell wall biosynthesis
MNENIFVVVPCFNETGVIRETLMTLLSRGYRVIVVDDGSERDLLPAIADLPIHYLRHEINLGQGAALQTGMDYSLECGAGIVVHFDADGQHRAEDIPVLVAPIVENRADVALGSRFLSETDAAAVPIVRRLVLKAARLINLLFTGVWLTDAHNGLRVLNRKALEKIRITENRMAHATEIIKLIKTNDLRCCECATHVVYTPYSRKKGQTMLSAVNIFFDLILNRFR